MKTPFTRPRPWCRIRGPAIILIAACVLPSCGNDSGTGLPLIQRSIIFVAVEPNPVIGTQNVLTGAVTAAYVVQIRELAGLGGEIRSVISTVFDPETGIQVAVTFFDDASLQVFEGESRIEPGGEAEVKQTVSYILSDFRVDTDLTVTVQFQDDRGSLINQSILVPIVPAPPEE